MYSYQGRGGRTARCAGRTATGTLHTDTGSVQLYAIVQLYDTVHMCSTVHLYISVHLYTTI